jgi:hypothetical protein
MSDKLSEMIGESARRSSREVVNKQISGPQYIITDPCYIMADDEYDALGQATDWNMDFNKPQIFTRRYHSDQKITIFKNKGTKYGDGSYNYRGYDVSVDSGQLCIAHNPRGWKEERLGAKFFKLEEAKQAWSTIMRHF